MPISTYKSLLCIRPKNITTDFLDPIGNIFGHQYFIIDDNDEAHAKALSTIEALKDTSLIVFLGHGCSTSLYSANTENYLQKNFIDSSHSKLFYKHNVLFLACRSEQFISRISDFKNIIGFGNIISSREEIVAEADATGVFRELEDYEIEMFNNFYVTAVKKTFELLLSEKIQFKQVASYISFFINKSIQSVLKDKTLKNRIELAQLLFEFRNEIKYLKNH